MGIKILIVLMVSLLAMDDFEVLLNFGYGEISAVPKLVHSWWQAELFSDSDSSV
jgi:hypothetical protein